MSEVFSVRGLSNDLIARLKEEATRRKTTVAVVLEEALDAYFGAGASPSEKTLQLVAKLEEVVTTLMGSPKHGRGRPKNPVAITDSMREEMMRLRYEADPPWTIRRIAEHFRVAQSTVRLETGLRPRKRILRAEQ